ncbi:MAG: FecR family protein [Acidobacteriota bacterium]|nr:FecR family protein [Acidobacteriota bacterium]
MNRIGENTNFGDGDGAASLDQEIRELLQHAGPRPKVPDEHLVKIKEAARAEWEQLVSEQKTSASIRALWVHRTAFAVAAALVMALGAGWWWLSRSGPVALETVAVVQTVHGEVRADGGTFEPGASLVEGSVISTKTGPTGPSLLAVRLSNGHSVRLDSDSRVRLLSGAALDLIEGAVYVDSGAAHVAHAASAAGSSVEITTVFGAVRDIGTQFEVRIQDGGAATLRLRVREGVVSVSRGAETHSAEAGQELTVDTRGAVEVGTVSRHGSEWDWAIEAAPGLEIEGLRLQEYLDWLTRETGIQARYSDSGVGESAGDIELFGSIEGLSPIQSVDAVLPSTGLDYQLAGHDLLIGSRPGV